MNVARAVQMARERIGVVGVIRAISGIVDESGSASSRYQEHMSRRGPGLRCQEAKRFVAITRVGDQAPFTRTGTTVLLQAACACAIDVSARPSAWVNRATSKGSTRSFIRPSLPKISARHMRGTSHIASLPRLSARHMQDPVACMGVGRVVSQLTKVNCQAHASHVVASR